MAEGGQTEEAQTPAQCEYCEEANIYWKCLNCDLLLCKLCTTKIHSKSKANQGHRIVNIKNFGTEDAAEDHRKFDLENIPCQTHEGQKCLSFCMKCKLIICFLCLTEFHQTHKQLRLIDYYNEKMVIIKKQKEDLNSCNQALHNQETYLQEMLSDMKNEETELKTNILDREKQLTDKVKKHSENLIQQLNEENHSVMEEILDKLKDIQIRRDKVSKECLKINQVILSHKANDVFAEENLSSETFEKELEDCIILPPEKKFFKIEEDIQLEDDYLKKHFGSLSHVSEVPDFNPLFTCETNLTAIDRILCCGTNVWIGCYGDKNLYKVEFKCKNGEIEEPRETERINLEVFDYSMMENGDLVVSTRQNQLKLLTSDGNTQSYLKSFSPAFTIGVHVTDESYFFKNKILVGISETPNPKKGQGLLQVINLSDGTEHTYKTDKDDQRIFTYPYRIDTFNNKIFVIDLIDKSMVGRVIALDEDGSIKWTYNGTGQGANAPFNPRGLTVASIDMISMVLISDSIKDTIDILNLNGEVIVQHNAKDYGIVSPTSLHYYEFIVWVGCKKKDRADDGQFANICALVTTSISFLDMLNLIDHDR